MKNFFHFTAAFALTGLMSACADEGNPAGQSSDGGRERSAHRNRGHETDGVYSRDGVDSTRHGDLRADTTGRESGKGTAARQSVPNQQPANNK